MGTEMTVEQAGNIAARMVDDYQYLLVSFERLGVSEDPEIVQIMESLKQSIIFFI